MRPGYEHAQVLQRLDPKASLQAGTNLRYAGVDANMASRALKVSSPYVATADNAGDQTKPEIPVQQLTPGDVSRVREALGTLDGEALDDEPLEDDEPEGSADDDDVGPETEIRRLEEELERCRAVQRALERFVEALDGTS